MPEDTAESKLPRETLGRELFERLLSTLSPEREAAGLQYEQLRLRLIKYFSWEQCDAPEHLADEALNRLARKITEGETPVEVSAYALSIARYVLLEHRRRVTAEAKAALEWTHAVRVRDDARMRVLAGALDDCLNAMIPSTRDFILRYYTGDERARIRNRQAMSQEMKLGLNALRNKALRLRQRLERCISKKLADGGGE